MAANIEIRRINGVETASFVENGSQERAWHGLGQVFDRPLTVTEALNGCNANFNVSKQPIVALPPSIVELMNSGETINAAQLKQFIIKDKVSTMRTDIDGHLGVVGKDYGVVQNIKGFEFIDALCTGSAGTPCIESAGLLGHGERVFITAKFPEPIRLAHNSNDLVEMYIIFTNSHNGTGALSAMVSPIRVVCANTLNAAFHNNAGRWNVRHTSNVNNRISDIAEASRALNLYEIYKEEFECRMDALSKVQVTDKQVQDIIAQSVLTPDNLKVYMDQGINGTDLSTRAKNTINGIIDTIHTGIGQDMVQAGTGLWVYNGITCYFQNTNPQKTSEKQFDSLMDTNGLAKTRTQKVFDLVSEVA